MTASERWDNAHDPGQPDIDRALLEEHARRQSPKRLPSLAAMRRQFEALGEDRYRLAIPDIAVTLELDRLRREHHELIGELSASCELPGARTFDGSLSIADLNLSSARARQDRAKLLKERANTGEQVDWIAILEEFSQRVLRADRAGQPAVDLRQIPRPNATEDIIEVAGLVIPRRHPTILFGDGGSGKSYLALYLAGTMAEKGVSVALFDWELAGDDHRDRLERLFPEGMPRILYVKCDRPLVFEADRLRRIVRDNNIEMACYDSVAFACDGPPEAAEVAGRYFRAVRQIGAGSIHIAHVSKGGENSDSKPFGSVFWSNSARSTWYVKQDDATAGTDALRIGLFHRKANLGRLRAPVGYSITFGEETTTFRRTDVADSADLSQKLTMQQRMYYLLRKGSLTIKEIADELEAKPETIERTAYRNKNRFIVLEGGRVGLVENRI